MLIKHLSNEEIKSLRSEFEKMDTDNSGFLEYNELRDALKQFNIKMKSEEIDSMINELDFHDNHKVNYTEFLAAQIDLKKFLTMDRLNAIFTTFDTDGSGKITK